MASAVSYNRSPANTSVLWENSDQKEKTLVLRKQAKEMQRDVETQVDARVQDFKARYDKATDEELQQFIDDAFNDVKREVNGKLDEMKQEVLKNAPKKPVRQPGQSDEEFEKLMKEYDKLRGLYKAFVGLVAEFLQGLTSLFSEVFKCIRDFFHSLWTWIRQAIRNIAEKIASFIKYLKEKISIGIEALAGRGMHGLPSGRPDWRVTSPPDSV